MAWPRTRSSAFRLTVRCVALALSLVSNASRLRAQAPRGLFSDELALRAAAPVAGARGNPMVLRSRTAAVNLTTLAEPGLAGTGFGTTQVAARTVDLNLFSDVNLVAQLDHVEAVSSLGYAWVGSVIGVEASQVILAVADGVFDGAIILPQHLYSVRSQPDGAYAVTEINRAAIPPDGDPITPVLPNAGGAAVAAGTPPTAAADSGDTIDLLLYYTTAAKTAIGSTAAINAYLTASIAQVNAVYTASAIPMRLRLVGAFETADADAGDLSIDLPNMRNNPDAKVMRDRLGADFVGVLTARDSTNSGLAYIMGGSSVSASFAPFAISSFVYYNFLGYIYALAHELGHNMGCLHEPGNNSNNGAYSYSQGFTDPTNRFYTVMSYGLNCTGCTAINQFSSPVNLYQGHPVGTSTQDNQRTILNTQPIFANFRQAVSGTVGAPTNFVASSSGSTVTLTWGRPASGTPTSYVIEAGSSNGLANLATVNTGSTATTFTTSGVANGYYVVRVRAAAGSDVGPMSNEAGLRVGSCSAAPAAPGGLASVVSGSTVYLTWNLSSTATTYVLEAGSASGLANLASSDLNNGLNAYSVAAVPRGTYFVRVRAKSSCGTSGASSEVRVVVP